MIQFEPTKVFALKLTGIIGDFFDNGENWAADFEVITNGTNLVAPIIKMTLVIAKGDADGIDDIRPGSYVQVYASRAKVTSEYVSTASGTIEYKSLTIYAKAIRMVSLNYRKNQVWITDKIRKIVYNTENCVVEFYNGISCFCSYTSKIKGKVVQKPIVRSLKKEDYATFYGTIILNRNGKISFYGDTLEYGKNLEYSPITNEPYGLSRTKRDMDKKVNSDIPISYSDWISSGKSCATRKHKTKWYLVEDDRSHFQALRSNIDFINQNSNLKLYSNVTSKLKIGTKCMTHKNRSSVLDFLYDCKENSSAPELRLKWGGSVSDHHYEVSVDVEFNDLKTLSNILEKPVWFIMTSADVYTNFIVYRIEGNKIDYFKGGLYVTRPACKSYKEFQNKLSSATSVTYTDYFKKIINTCAQNIFNFKEKEIALLGGSSFKNQSEIDFTMNTDVVFGQVLYNIKKKLESPDSTYIEYYM